MKNLIKSLSQYLVIFLFACGVSLAIEDPDEPVAVAVERPLAPGVPDIARGYEEIYLRFVRGYLIYKPNRDNDTGRVDLPFAALPNPLRGTFDLRDCGDAGTYLSLNSGYRERRRAENAGKVEVWITPRFVVEQGLGEAGHLAPIMDTFTAPVGVFWTWGEWASMNDYAFLSTIRYFGRDASLWDEIWHDSENSGWVNGVRIEHAAIVFGDCPLGDISNPSTPLGSRLSSFLIRM